MKYSDTLLVELLKAEQVKIIPLPDLDKVKGVCIPLHLGNEFMPITKIADTIIDPTESNDGIFSTHVEAESIVIGPNQQINAVTLERVEIADQLVGRLDGRSRLARFGVSVHITAHRIDPGFKGNIVLEIYNCSPNHILLKPGMEIGALLIEPVEGKVKHPYSVSGSYKDQKGVCL